MAEGGAWLSPPGDAEMLENQLARLIVRPAQWPIMGEANRRRAQQFSWDAIAADTRTVYLEALARRDHRRLGSRPLHLIPATEGGSGHA